MDAGSGSKGSNRTTGRGVRTRGGRLPPIATPNARGKKSFMPTVPQRRIKVEKDDTSQQNTSERGQKRERGRGRGGRGRAQFVQTAGGLFGEGLAYNTAKRASGDVGITKADASLLMPVIKKDQQKTKKDQDADDEKFLREEEKYNEEFSDEGDEQEDELQLVRLPLLNKNPKPKNKDTKTDIKSKPLNDVNTKTEPAFSVDKKDENTDLNSEPSVDHANTNIEPTCFSVKIKQELIDEVIGGVKIKKEPCDPFEMTTAVKIKKEPEDFDKMEKKEEKVEKKEEKKEEKVEKKEEKKEEKYEIKGQSILENELLLIQLPDRLPFGTPKAEKSAENKDIKNEGEDMENDGKKTQKDKCSIEDLDEGCIGKLQFLDSGELRLVLGNGSYSLYSEEDSACLQEAISLDDEQLHLTVLGNVLKKITFMPSLRELDEM